jgi:YHS domain-containing protein
MEVVDPVCGMKMDEDDAYAGEEHKGEVYHFCSRKCHEAFQKEPDKFAKKAEE